MNSKRLVALVVAPLALLSLAGCPVEPSSSGAHGTVIKKSTSYVKGNKKYKLTVKEDGGKSSKGLVTKGVYAACSVGERWPDCKKGKKS